MDVILVEDVEKLGKKGDIVKVKDGFFRNFLFPRGKALPSNKATMRLYGEKKAREEAKGKQEREKALVLAQKLEKMTLTLPSHVGEEDKLFGSITNQEITAALKVQGMEVDKRKIELEEPIKKTGTYTVKVKLHTEVEAQLKVKVVKG